MNSESKYIRFQRFGSFVPGGAWWLLMTPGLLLIGLAIAILIWPNLLAYIIAFTILSVGITLVGWSMALRRAAKSVQQSKRDAAGYTDINGTRQIIYYD